MRSRARIASALVLLLALLVPTGPAAAVAPPMVADGYRAAYAGESAFTAAPAGTTARLTVVYANTGTQTWLPGIVGLLVCAQDQVTCGVPSVNLAFASDWFGPSVYATVLSPVAPGQNAFFTYDIAVPLGTAADVTTVFHGAVGLIETGEAIQIDGYFQANTTPATAIHTLRATFLADPIPADGQATSTLQVEVLGPAGEIDAADDKTVITIAEPDASQSVCVIQFPRATARAGMATFVVLSTEDPGRCDIDVSDDRGASTAATLVTKAAGSAVRLTVSGNGSPQLVGGGAPVTVSVDIDDVNVELVGDDSTSVVTMILDPDTCTGAVSGDVYFTSGNAVVAVDGRAWFALRSNGAYPGCRATVTSPGLRANATTVVFVAGAANHLTCAFSPQAIGADGTAIASLELRDVFGNPVESFTPHGVSLVRVSGDATALVGDVPQALAPGAALFSVTAGDHAGVDVYVALLDGTAGPLCAITVH